MSKFGSSSLQMLVRSDLQIPVDHPCGLWSESKISKNARLPKREIEGLSFRYRWVSDYCTTLFEGLFENNLNQYINGICMKRIFIAMVLCHQRFISLPWKVPMAARPWDFFLEVGEQAISWTKLDDLKEQSRADWIIRDKVYIFSRDPCFILHNW